MTTLTNISYGRILLDAEEITVFWTTDFTIFSGKYYAEITIYLIVLPKVAADIDRFMSSLQKICNVNLKAIYDWCQKKSQNKFLYKKQNIINLFLWKLVSSNVQGVWQFYWFQRLLNQFFSNIVFAIKPTDIFINVHFRTWQSWSNLIKKIAVALILF